VSVLLRDEAMPYVAPKDAHRPSRRSRSARVPLASANELVERFGEALGFLSEEGIALRISLGCDRWTAIGTDRALLEGLLLGLTLRARDHMRQGGLLSLQTSLIQLEENPSEETGLPPGEYVRVRVADTGGWSADSEETWTTRMGSSQRLERPSLATLRQTAERGGGALVCTRDACCGGRADLYLPAQRRRIRSVLKLT
jgi:hypothetical protein